MAEATTDIRITNQMLVIGPSTYPLRGITEITDLDVIPKVNWFKAGAWLALWIFVIIVTAAWPPPFPFVGWIGLIALAGLVVWIYNQPETAQLSVATAGTNRVSVVSEDKRAIRRLAENLIEALDNPQAEYAVTIPVVNNFGDTIVQNGANNIGKLIK
ncbi:DUF6232 family protein [Promicromonospora sp. NPDC023805]|uniref:DUF6232 family protein n=1 Tax=Promicromonospora sp. NPDC023805 TaxID=3154696 RepID=UPI0033E0AB40